MKILFVYSRNENGAFCCGAGPLPPLPGENDEMQKGELRNSCLCAFSFSFPARVFGTSWLAAELHKLIAPPPSIGARKFLVSFLLFQLKREKTSFHAHFSSPLAPSISAPSDILSWIKGEPADSSAPVSFYNRPLLAYQLPVGPWPLFAEKETTAGAFTRSFFHRPPPPRVS